MRVLLVLICFLLLLSCIEEVAKNENDTIEIYDFATLEPLLNTESDSVHVVNFWATWCAPCIKELPYFQEIHETYQNKNLKVLLVSLDFPEKFESQLIPFVKKNDIGPQVVLLDDPNENSWIPKIDSTWSGALPATLIYTKDKRVFYEQSFTKETLQKEIEKFIKI